MRLSRDEILGLGVLLLAAAYWAAADQIPVSLLADGVGADGVPKVLAVALAAVAALLVATSRLKQPAEGADEEVVDEVEAQAARRAHLRAGGLLAGLVVYILLLPYLGYPLAIALLLAGAAVYGGTKLKPGVAVIAVVGSIVFWVFFVVMLNVGMPTGIWTAGF